MVVCFVLVIGIFLLISILQANSLWFNRNQEWNFLERWALLGFLLDALVVGLIYRWFVRREKNDGKGKWRFEIETQPSYSRPTT